MKTKEELLKQHAQQIAELDRQAYDHYTTEKAAGGLFDPNPQWEGEQARY